MLSNNPSKTLSPEYFLSPTIRNGTWGGADDLTDLIVLNAFEGVDDSIEKNLLSCLES